MFPAGVFLYTSGDRRVLFDTGYAPEPWRTGVPGWAYRRLLPPSIRPGDTIAEQLDAASVTHVVLSHLHPDHIGGVRFFPHATFVMSEGARATVAAPTLRSGLLPRLLPPWFDGARVVVAAEFPDRVHGMSTFDLFGDGSYLLVDLPGHADGQLGALIEGRTLLAADAAWGRSLLGEEDRIRMLPRAVAHDPAAQRRTAQALLDAERNGVRLLFSHDRHPVGVDLL